MKRSWFSRHPLCFMALYLILYLSAFNFLNTQIDVYKRQALRYARTILDGKVSSGSGMWSNGAVWSAGGYYRCV